MYHHDMTLIPFFIDYALIYYLLGKQVKLNNIIYINIKEVGYD